MGEGDVVGVCELLEYKPDLSYSTLQGTALHIAAQKGRMEILSLLLGAACNVNSTATSGMDTPLHRAASLNRVEAVIELLAARGDANMQNKKGQTALDVAIKDKSDGVLELLNIANTSVPAPDSPLS